MKTKLTLFELKEEWQKRLKFSKMYFKTAKKTFNIGLADMHLKDINNAELILQELNRIIEID